MSFRGVIVAVCAVSAAASAGCSRQSEQSAGDKAGAAMASVPPEAAPSPHGPYALEWGKHDVPATIAAAGSVPVQVTVKNTGNWTWPDPATASPAQPTGRYAVRLAYHWFDAKGKAVDLPEARSDLTAPVRPGGAATYAITVSAPTSPGKYTLTFDLVEELVTWFAPTGTPKLEIPVKVD